MKNSLSQQEAPHAAPAALSIHIVLLIVLSIILFHAWLASYSSKEDSGRTTYYYAYLSQAFMQGDLHLPLQPDPELLALENPYDLSARAELEKRGVTTPVDFSLYKGKFYLYWGPVPALMLSLVQVFSRYPQPIADFFVAFLFGVGILLAQTLLLTIVWRTYFSALPAWSYYIALLLAGLLWPAALLRHEHNHARIYEAAIAAGQFFLISGIWMAFAALRSSPVSNRRLTLAAILWVLAIGSRHLLVVPIGFLGLTTVIWIFRSTSASRFRIGNLVSLGAPMVLGALALGWYNWARFGSVPETGFNYALAGIDIQNYSSELFSASNSIQNLYNYLLNPPDWMPAFPFVSMLEGNESLGLSFYFAEPMTGLLYTFPFAVFAMVPLLLYVLSRFKANAVASPLRTPESSSLAWLVLSLSGSVLASFSLLTIFFWAGMRYAADFLPTLTILSSIGFWQGHRYLETKLPAKSYYSIAGMILGGISIVISTLLALSTI